MILVLLGVPIRSSPILQIKQHLLGYGSHGHVYALRDRYAVKCAHPTSIRQLRKENEVYLFLEGTTGILRRFYYFEITDTAYLVLEPAEASLSPVFLELSRGLLPFDSVLLASSMVVTLLPVIAQIHAKGVIHGDIHPGNILLTSTGPKLIDFGSSRFMENTGKTAFNYGDTYDHSLYFAGARRLASSTPTDCDDITSFSYMVVYIARGLRMPWDQRFWEITGRDLSLDMTLSELIAMKNSFSSSELCEGLPSLFESFLSAALGSITMNYDYNHWWNEFNKFAGKRTWSRPESS